MRFKQQSECDTHQIIHRYNAGNLHMCYCICDFSSYFQAGSESRSVGLGLSQWPPGAGQAPVAVLRGSLCIADLRDRCRPIVCCLSSIWLDSIKLILLLQEAFEKCWAHSPLRAAACRIAIHQVSLLSHRTPPAHWCLQQQRRRQRQRMTEGTAMAPWNGPNYYYYYYYWVSAAIWTVITTAHKYTPRFTLPEERFWHTSVLVENSNTSFH